MLYGGAAGGGKSDALLMGALQFVDVPGYAALILRRTLADLVLPGALMDRARDWLAPTSARWTGGATWVFPSGARIQFGYLEHEKQKYRYQSSEYQYIGFDELTQFSETQYRYMFSRLRRPKIKPSDPPALRKKKLSLAKVPLRMRTASNPGGAGHEWVKRRFLDTQQANRRFIQAMLKDNPHLDEETYVESLAELDPITKAQLLRGDWGARQTGGYFDRGWFVRHIIDVPPDPGEVLRRVRYWDLASTEADPLTGSDPDWTAGCLMSLLRNGTLVIENITRFRKNPGGVEGAVAATAAADPPNTEVWIEKEPGSSGKSLIDYYRRHVLPGHVVKPDNKTGSKEVRAAPLSSRSQQGDIKLVRGAWIDTFFDEAETFPAGAHDDMVDAASGAFHVLTLGKKARLIA